MRKVEVVSWSMIVSREASERKVQDLIERAKSCTSGVMSLIVMRSVERRRVRSVRSADDEYEEDE